MRTRFGTILAAAAALCIGAAAGWLAARAWGGGEVLAHRSLGEGGCKYGNMETANEKAKPRRKALIRSSADAEVQKRILENKISYLEKCIAAAKGEDGRARSPVSPEQSEPCKRSLEVCAPPAGKTTETHAELVERLMKLPSNDERYLAFARLDEKTQNSFTIAELRKLCPKQMTIDEIEEELAERLERMTDVAARRIGVLDTLDQSGLNDDERKVHAEFMERLAEWPEVFADMIDQPDSMTFGEVVERINKAIAHQKRLGELVKDEREMLVEQVIKGFSVPGEDAEELRAVLDDVRAATSTGYFEKKD